MRVLGQAECKFVLVVMQQPTLTLAVIDQHAAGTRLHGGLQRVPAADARNRHCAGRPETELGKYRRGEYWCWVASPCARKPLVSVGSGKRRLPHPRSLRTAVWVTDERVRLEELEASLCEGDGVSSRALVSPVAVSLTPSQVYAAAPACLRRRPTRGSSSVLTRRVEWRTPHRRLCGIGTGQRWRRGGGRRVEATRGWAWRGC